MRLRGSSNVDICAEIDNNRRENLPTVDYAALKTRPFTFMSELVFLTGGAHVASTDRHCGDPSFLLCR